MLRPLLVLLAGLVLLSAPVQAVEPDEILSDPKLEARARAISAGLRCLVCQNQSIDDSNAPLARDLRLLVRERLQAGDTDAQVMRFVEDRYGQYVLLRPPFDMNTLLLWLAPIIVLLGAAYVAVRAFGARAPAGAATPALSAAEEDRLRTLLASADQKSDGSERN